jgi:superfamily II RNA helicase
LAATLNDFVPRSGPVNSDELLGRFLEYAESRKLQLYSTQEAAVLELFEGRNVILNTPTGSGKSLVASALHFKSLSEGKRSVYTCPIKALVNEKWMSLCREFGPNNVGLSTGDATVNREAPILCCTAEILANIALRHGEAAEVHDVVMDEFHYYSDRERGVAWQVPLLTLAKTRFLLMSATLGDTAFFESELTKLTGLETVTVSAKERPVPLDFKYSELPLATTLETLVAENKAPVYVVHFTQLEAAQSAQDFTSINVCSKDEKGAIAQAIEGFKFSSPYGAEIKRWLRHGIGIHHAGLLPKYRILVEQLAQRGLLKVICGTDTLGVGINVPIRTVLFTRLCKFDGQKTGILSARDFHQIAGRAGRKGYDDVGYVVAQAPEHVVENLKLEEKARRDGKKVVRRQPPEKNFVNWDKQTFARLIAAPPERLTSRFHVSHAMLLNVLSREGDGCRAMQQLVARSHESPKQKHAHIRRGWQLFRSLVERNIIEIAGASPTTDESTPPSNGRKLRINVELPENFSMDQTLSLYLLETIPLLQRLGPTALDPAPAPILEAAGAPDDTAYALDLITLVESILEDPDIILRKQLDKLKGQKLAEMKHAGMEYQDRMDELEKLEHPKPNREFIYSTFNAFAEKHPWVGQENIRPKSIAREMFEQFRSFADYIKDYELQRAEGVLLRHITSVHKVLVQTVPDAAKNDSVREMQEYLRLMIRQVDSSLVEEWEKMRDPNYVPRSEEKEVRPPGAEEAMRDITRDAKAFTASVRARIFSFLRTWVNGDFDQALAQLASPENGEGTPWTAETLARRAQEHRAEHGYVRLDPEARNLRYTFVKVADDKRSWLVHQVLVDPEEHNDWEMELAVDLAASRAAEEPVLKLNRIGPIVR